VTKMTVGVENGCSCDPAVVTTDCTQAPCTTFFSVFLFLECVVLSAYVGLICLVEFRHRIKSRTNLWRIVLGTAATGCFAKVLRLALLANSKTRFEVGQVVLLFLYNTHLTFGFIACLTLLYFWARLHHDLRQTQTLFGKLFPLYIGSVVVTIVFYYAQVIVQGAAYNETVMYVLQLVNGLVCFSLAVAFLIYGSILWREFVRAADPTSLFYRIFVSAIVTSVFIILFCLELAISKTTSFNTTRDYLVKHSLYEILFLGMFVAIPSGFIAFYFRSLVYGEETKSSQHVSASSLTADVSRRSLTTDVSTRSLTEFSTRSLTTEVSTQSLTEVP